MNETGWLGLHPVTQFGVVTPDLDAAIARDLELRPHALWTGWTYGPDLLSWQRIGGQPATYTMNLAVSGTNPQLEFVQPLGAHTSLWRRLEAGGHSLHHMGILVNDFDRESARLRTLGVSELEAGGGHGLDGDGAFGYFDTVALCGIIIEIIQPPARRPAPHRLF